MDENLRLEVELETDPDDSNARDREELASALHNIAGKLTEGYKGGGVGNAEWDLTRVEDEG